MSRRKTKENEGCMPGKAVAPWHPGTVMAAAIVLPGCGQLLNNMPGRAVMMVFYMVLLGAVTYYFTTPEHSFVGRHAGGFFVYALSVLDAYKWARYRYEVHRSGAAPGPAS